MAYTVQYEHPHFATGEDAPEFGIAGLGSIPNGGTIEVDEDMERNFLMTQGKTLEDALDNDAMITLSGSSALDPSETEDILSQVVVEEPVVEEQTVVDEPQPNQTVSAADLGLGGEQNA